MNVTLRCAARMALAGLVFGLGQCCIWALTMTPNLQRTVTTAAYYADWAWMNPIASHAAELTTLYAASMLVSALMLLIWGIEWSGAFQLVRSLRAKEAVSVPDVLRAHLALMLVGLGWGTSVVWTWHDPGQPDLTVPLMLMGFLAVVWGLGFWLWRRSSVFMRHPLALGLSLCITLGVSWMATVRPIQALHKMLFIHGRTSGMEQLFVCCGSLSAMEVVVLVYVLAAAALGCLFALLRGGRFSAVAGAVVLTLLAVRIPLGMLKEQGYPFALDLPAATPVSESVYVCNGDRDLQRLPITSTTTYFNAENRQTVAQKLNATHADFERQVLQAYQVHDLVLQWRTNDAVDALRQMALTQRDSLIDTMVLLAVLDRMPATPYARSTAEGIPHDFVLPGAFSPLHLARLYRHLGESPDPWLDEARRRGVPDADMQQTIQEVIGGSLVRGDITRDGQPLAGVQVRLFTCFDGPNADAAAVLNRARTEWNGEQLTGSDLTLTAPNFLLLRDQASEPIATTAADGSFEVDNLNPGHYLLAIRLPGNAALQAQQAPGLIVVSRDSRRHDLGTITLISR